MQIWIVALACLSAVGAWATTTAIARRAQSQPVGLDLDAERLALSCVWADPRRLPYLAEITDDMLASGTYRRIWQAMLEAAPECEGVNDDASAEVAGTALSLRASSWRTDVTAALDAVDVRVLVDLDSTGPEGQDLASASSDELAVRAGQGVVATANDRTVMNGGALVVPSDTPDSISAAAPPVVRTAAHVTTARRVVVAALSAIWALSLAWLMPMTGYDGLAFVLAVASWMVLGAGMLVVALVDHDTMYIDMRAWLAGTLGAWVLAAAAAWQADALDNALVGIAMVVAAAILFEGTNWLYRKIRGRDGQGFGDTLIIIATVGIPTALTGQAALGYYSVMGALVAAIIGWVVARALGRAGKDIPFAFGPWLALGPVIAVGVAGVPGL